MNSVDSVQVARAEAGTRWHRVDFHLHSPGVVSFTCPDGAELRTDAGRLKLAQQYVERLEKAGITLCAITDYNGVREEWFVPIRDLAKACDIKVLPGAELSFNYGKSGLHILFIFGEDAEPKRINMAIQGLQRSPSQPLLLQDRKHTDIDLRTNLIDAVAELRRQFPCLVIPPHPSEKNGICRSLQPKDAAQTLQKMRPDALEHCPIADVERLRTTGELDLTFLERLAQVEFSDAHTLAEIGTKKGENDSTRATWLKLSVLDLSAIRLALHDPATRVTVDGVPEPHHARLHRIEVEGSGFLGKLTIGWNADLNAIIGGRGAGKSAVIETLRYVLDSSAYSEAAYREDLVRHALGSGGKASVLLERPSGEGSRRYRVERVLGEQPRVYDDESHQRIDVPPTDLFGPGGPPAIFGQREIYAVSGNEEYRLRLLDDLIGEEAERKAAAVRESAESLRDNARKVLDIARKLGKRDEIMQRQKTIDHEVSVYEREGVADKLRVATDLKSDGQHLKAASEAVIRARLGLTETFATIEASIGRTREGLGKAKSSEKKILEEAAALVDRVASRLASLRTHSTELFIVATDGFRGIDARWREALQPLEAELNRVKQQLHNEILDPDRLLELTEERAALGPLLSEFERLSADRDEFLKQRRTIVDALKQRRLEEHQLRRERADAIGTELGGRLKIRVEFKGQKDEYRRRLAALLKGSGVTEDAIKRLCSPEATDGVELAGTVRIGAAGVEKQFSLTSAMAQRLCQWLTAEEERLFELEALVPLDAVHVELKVEEEYRALNRLSVGQRATAILLLLFALRGRILVLDQPEDDLDNRFVYEDVVTLLRDQKGLRDGRDRRQIITATHNANIPVLGDAEQVLALEARDGKAHVLSRASIDDLETRRLIKSVMEGGEEAFRRRAEKYGEP